MDGTIGIVASLSSEKFRLLEKVEKKMEEEDMSLGGVDHARLSLSSVSVGNGLIVGVGRSRMDGREL